MSDTWPNRPHTLGSRLTVRALRLAGWTPVLVAPPTPKVVACVAPHTSNHDFLLGVMWKWATRSPVHFVAKHSLFVFPVGIFMRAVGGIAIDRRRAGGNFVDAVVERIHRDPEIMLTVAPEGTRSRTEYWKTGFYYMALGAGVPIAVTVFDWGRRQVGIIGYVQPTGDIEADFAQIRQLMQGVHGHTPADAGPVRPRPGPAP
ncbi:glycerol acyltransferase [Deinococcus malanensis]|uniref:Glycerol acyltransferase n=2 Tax=Deinococcus malanensis TaxID=1706855 RepID=A0ABQ2EV10_9DEIO|nr:lysophospholipid acyltransferase family protein [Deinococcus malanensis]GGK26880.1 glycerol acyltransferase [Deinococcus malanensis]